MIDVLGLKVKLVVCKIIREEHGLAMSSRNERLNSETRKRANVIYKTLLAVRRRIRKEELSKARNYALNRLAKEEGFKPEYFDFIDGRTLDPIQSVEDSDYIVACTAVWAGKIRLIDNMIMKKPAK